MHKQPHQDRKKQKEQAPPPKPGKVRDAGPEAMENPPEDWEETDESSDESFPASDPPAKY